MRWQRAWRLGMREVRPTLTLAFPIMSGMLSQMLLGLADTLMVGRLGTVPLAAASFVNILFHLPLVFGIGLLSSVAVASSQAFGSRQHEALGEWLRHGLALAAGLGVVMALLLGASRLVLGHLGQPPEVVAASGTYLWLVSASIPPLLVSHTIKQYNEALNRPWIPNWILLGGVGLNIFLNWLWIYGNWGMPALGLEGAGWATLVARLAMAGTMMVHLTLAPALRPFQPARWLAPLSRDLLGRLWHLGWPVAGQHLFEVSAFAFCGLMTGWINAASLASHQIAITCAATTFMFPLGVGMAACIRVGHAWGAGQTRRQRRIGWVGLVLAVSIMGMFGIVFMTAGLPIARLFTEAPEVIELTAALLWVAAIFQVADGVQVVSISALRGMSDVRVPALMAVMAYWVIAVPLGYILAFPAGLGAVGVWWALALGLGVAAILLTWRFHLKTRPTGRRLLGGS